MSEIDLRKRLSVYSASAGTGKTFTLAAYYVGLLLSGENYKNILAVTFTNKATEEMKVRIMGYLYDIAQGNANDFFAKAKDYMLPGCANLRKSDEELRVLAGKCFTEMLADYDDVHVSTIDSFLQTLLSGMAQLLNQRIGFAPELDQKQLFTEAVDRLLSERMEGNTATIVSDYISNRMDDEKNWDIRQNLIKTAEILYGERAQIYAAAGQIEMDPAKIETYRNTMAGWRGREEFVELEQLFDIVKQPFLPLKKSENGKTDNGRMNNSIYKIGLSLQNNAEKGDDYFAGVFAKMEKWRTQYGDNWYENAVRLDEQCKICRPLYFEAQLTLKYLNDMRLMQALVDVINETLHEQNKVLLAETSSILRNALEPGDADFILEKVGIRYRHIMIDEFQDTSKLQWEVFLPLLEEILSAGRQTVLIVGDIKQSIYRWRNGDWHIMADLPRNERIGAHYNGKSLTRNFRSQKEVVQFNLEAMQSAAQNPAVSGVGPNLYNENYEEQRLGDYYNNSHSEGYVRMRVFPTPYKKEKAIYKCIMADMFRTMEELISKGIRPADMLILVRKNKEAMRVARYFQENILTDKDGYPNLNKTRLVSRDSFVLKQSKSVLTIINALRYIENKDAVAGHFVKLATGQEDVCTQLNAIDKSLPLYEMAQTVVGLLLCDQTTEDIAYVNCLLDNIRAYISENGSNRKEFLQYWNDFLCNKAIPSAQTDAIQIMTVHSSKGLESKTLFIPFCSWPLTEDKGVMWCKRAQDSQQKYIPVEIQKNAAGTAYGEAYEKECTEQKVDNLNLFYVALTRAADNLFIYVDENVTQNGLNQNNVGYLLIQKEKIEDEVLSTYENGKDDPENMEFVEAEKGTLTIRAAKAAAQSTFGFEKAKAIGATLQSDSSRVRFRQSQEGAMHAENGGKTESENDRKEIGTICHDLLSRIRTRDDVERVVETAWSKGVFANQEQRDQATEYINRIWENPKMAQWYDGSWKLLCEQAILTDGGEELRPDRVMIRGNEAIVLDYKFGEKLAKHTKQVEEYMKAMEKLGYAPVSGYLWYAQTGELLPL